MSQPGRPVASRADSESASGFNAAPASAYRPDIDGLRAVAVLSVVLFHAFPSLLPGGFVGVDVFFVISGFLISGQLYGSLDGGRFSLIQFYGRRIRRIFPALVLTIAACMSFGWFALFAHEYAQLGKHAAGGAGFIANFVFLDEVGYFQSPSHAKPLIHLWSLGIEEQFYIVWPVLLWMLWSRKRWLLAAILTMAAVSFAFNVLMTRVSPTEAFYLPHMRFWEFLAGALLAALDRRNQPPQAGGMARLSPNPAMAGAHESPPGRVSATPYQSLGAGLGMGLIVETCLVLSSAALFPGWWALPPVVGAALVIHAGERGWVNRVVLAHPLMVRLGLISFPLYLWHWPLLSFANIVESGKAGLELRLLAVLCAVPLAWATYQYVERPLRWGNHRTLKTAGLTLSMILMGCWGYITFDQQGRNVRDGGAMEQLVKGIVDPIFSRAADGSCEKLLQKAPLKDEVCQATHAQPDVLVLGDSHAIALHWAAFARRVELRTLLIAGHGCLPFENFVSREATEPVGKNCTEISAGALHSASRLESIDTVVLATRGPFYFTGTGIGAEGATTMRIYQPDGLTLPASQSRAFLEGYSDTVRRFLALGKKVVFLIDVPELEIHPRTCAVRRPLTFKADAAPACTLPRAAVQKRQKEYRELVEELRKRHPAMQVHDSLDVFCDADTCFSNDGEQILYWDDDHLSLAGSIKLLSHMRSKGALPGR